MLVTESRGIPFVQNVNRKDLMSEITARDFN
jgi:hypothetical protein